MKNWKRKIQEYSVQSLWIPHKRKLGSIVKSKRKIWEIVKHQLLSDTKIKTKKKIKLILWVFIESSIYFSFMRGNQFVVLKINSYIIIV